jgi:hypothetical protein
MQAEGKQGTVTTGSAVPRAEGQLSDTAIQVPAV